MAISKRKKEHTAFIASTEWAKIKIDLFLLRGEKCEQCGKEKNLHVHHLTYERFGGDEEPEDLLILCAGCHMKEHGLIKKKKRKKKHKVNKKKPSKRREEIEIIAELLIMKGYIAAAKYILKKSNSYMDLYVGDTAKRIVIGYLTRR